MNPITYYLRLNAGAMGSQARICVVKGEARSRRLSVCLHNGAEPYEPPEGASVVLKAVKSDGTIAYNDCELSGGLIFHTLSSALISVPGTIECEIAVYGADGGLLYSPRFDIYVSETLYDDGRVTSSDEFGALTSALNRVTTLEAEVTEAEDGRVAAETGRVSAEEIRVTNENGRVSSENERAELYERVKADYEGSLSARDQAEAARDEARLSAEAAKASQDAAALSASSAGEAMSDVAAKADAVRALAEETSANATAVEGHAATVTALASEVSANAQTATAKAAEAVQSAQTATAKAEEAAQSALAAHTGAQTASGHAATATTLAGEISSNAQTATAKAAEAAQSAQTAAAKSDAAEASALAAKTDADRAKAEADRAKEIAGGDYVTAAQGEAMSAAIDGKADAVHTHALADVTGLADNLAAKDTAIANQSAALDEHAADAGLHVTAAKQAAWDAKAEAGDVTAMQTSLAAHQSAAAYSEAGAHGLRYHAGELQYDDTGAWTTIETGSEVAEPGITDTPRLVNLSRRSAVLAAANWVGDAQPYTYELSVPGSRADGSNDVDIWFAPAGGNDEQAGAWSAARITGGAQGDDAVTLIAVGDKPGVDLPVIIRLVG